MAIATACKQAFREALLKKIVGEDVADLASFQTIRFEASAQASLARTRVGA